MARKAGMPASALSKIRADLAPHTQGRQRVHAGKYVHDEAFNEEQHDLGPWTQAPKSTRVDSYRYDYLNHALQVTWRNGKNHGYIYLEVPYEGYRSFARIASKGRYINTTVTLGGSGYRLMTPDEVQAASNPERGPLGSRVRE